MSANLATIVRINEIKPHANADALELAQIKGWQCVVKLGEFKAGDWVVYCEIDTWVPHAVAPFLSKGKEPRVYEGVLGERLRTIRLRGELSQGLVLPLSVLADMEVEGVNLYRETDVDLEGVDVTEYLGIKKWHAPVPTALAGEVWPWPNEIPNTDQENIQNIYGSCEMQLLMDLEWVGEEKLDGSSCTIYVKPDGTLGICSRTWELKQNEANANNAFIRAAQQSGILEVLPKLHERVALQAELCGPGIHGNPYRLQEPKLFVFDVYWIERNRYVTHSERQEVLRQLGNWAGKEITQVPFLGILLDGLPSLADILKRADGLSKVQMDVDVRREGIVFKTRHLVEGRVHSFKAVSNEYLLTLR